MKARSFKRMASILFLMVLPCTAVGGEYIHTLEDMVVTSTTTASGNLKKPSFAPASVTVITQKELLGREVVSLSDAVEGVEGISLVGARKSGNISIRGMDASATLILIDGKRLNSGFSDKANGMSEGLEANHIPPVGAIERIEIIRGPMSSIYGSDALGGVINVITKKSMKKWTGSVGASATWPEKDEAGDSRQGDVYFTGPVWKDLFRAQIWGFKKYRGEDEFEGGYFRSDRNNVSGRLTFTPDEKNEFHIQASHIDQDMESTEGKSSDATQSVAYDFDDQSMGYTGEWGRFQGEVDLYHKKTRRDGTNETWHPETENYAAEGKLVTRIADDFLTSGVQWSEDETSTASGYKSADGTFGRSSKMWEVAVFGEYDWAMTERFNLITGIRYHENEYYGSHFTYRGYGVFDTGSDWTVKGGYATGYKNPTLRETDPDIGNPQSWRTPVAYTYGNPDLEPEESDNFEIGVYYTPGDILSFNLTLFDTEYENKIINTGRTRFYDENGELITDAEGKIWGTYLNIGEATVRGAELAVTVQPIPEVTLRANYTYTDSKMDAADAVVTAPNGDTIVDWRFLDGKPLVGTPRNKIHLHGEWQIDDHWSVNATVNWHDDESNVNWSRTVAGESDYKTWNESITTIDLGVSWRPTEYLRLFLKIYNITDDVRSDDDEYVYLEEGRRFWLGTRVDF